MPLHTDAVQAVGILPVDFAASGADALTLTGTSSAARTAPARCCCGREVALTPLLHGGGQERDVRSGTLDTPAIVGARHGRRDRRRRRSAPGRVLGGLRDDLVGKVLAAVPDARLNGDPGTGVDGGPSRLPGNAHLSFPGCEGDSLLMLLDAHGIECSTGSACTAGVAQPSHVLLAMGADEAAARGSLRFSFGHTSTAADVDAVAAVIGAGGRAGPAGRAAAGGSGEGAR